MKAAPLWLALPFALFALAWQAQAQDGAAAQRSPVAVVTVRAGEPAVVEVAIEPRDAARGELYLSLGKDGTYHRRVLRLQGPGVYRLEADLSEGGEWGAYVRYGPGQAGYAGYGRIEVPEARGAVGRARLPLRDGYAGDVPGWVQPLGYLVLAVIAGIVLSGVAALLGWIGRQQRFLPG